MLLGADGKPKDLDLTLAFLSVQTTALFSVMLYEQLDLNLELVKMPGFTKKGNNGFEFCSSHLL